MLLETVIARFSKIAPNCCLLSAPATNVPFTFFPASINSGWILLPVPSDTLSLPSGNSSSEFSFSYSSSSCFKGSSACIFGVRLGFMSRGYVLDRLFLTRYFNENFFEAGIADAVRVDFKLRFVRFEKVQNFGDNVLFWIRKIDFEEIFLKA